MKIKKSNSYSDSKNRRCRVHSKQSFLFARQSAMQPPLHTSDDGLRIATSEPVSVLYPVHPSLRIVS
jgi:hypothetical protein